ncbi:hypothetical protein D3C73_185580 [compost metagenome]
MNNELGILISAQLNPGSSIKSINEGIRALSKHPSLQKLNLKVDVDQSFLETIKKFNQNISKFGSTLGNQNKVVKEFTTEIIKQDGSIEKVTKQILASGEQIEKTRTKHKENTKSVQQETQAINSQIVTLKQLEKELQGYALAKTKANKNKLGEITSYTHTYQNNANQKITVNADQNGVVRNYNQVSEILKQKQSVQNQEVAIDRAHYNALKTNQAKIEALDKQHYLALQENLRRDEDYARKQQAILKKIEDARLKFGHIKGKNAELDNLKNSVGQIGNIGNYTGSFKNIESDLSRVTTGLKAARRETISFGDAMKTAFQKFPIWINNIVPYSSDTILTTS